MMIPPAFNPKFKTSLCKHWMNTGNCTIGTRCHFAHGQSELRNPNDPLPAVNQGLMQDPKLLQMCFTGTLGPHNLKIMLCRYFPKNLCRYGNSCHFAHSAQEIKGMDELRHHHVKMIVQQYHTLLQQQHLLTTAGQTTFTITADQVGNQIELEINRHVSLAQLLYLVQQLSIARELPEDVKLKIRQAGEVLDQKNLQGVEKTLNEIIYRPNVPIEERKVYDKIMNDSAEVGNQITTQYLRSIHDFMEEQANNLQEQYQRQAEANYGVFNPYGQQGAPVQQQVQMPHFG